MSIAFIDIISGISNEADQIDYRKEIFDYFIDKIYNEIKKEGKRSYKEVLFNGPFILYAIFYMLMYGVLKTSNNYYPLLLESRNLSESIFGYNYTIFVGVEAAMLIVLDKINKRVNYKNLMLIAILFA